MPRVLYDEVGVLYDSPGVQYDGLRILETSRASYRVQVFAFADNTSFGIGNLVADLELVKNVGYADYINDVPEAFFTLDQGDPKIATLLPYIGRAHVRVLRNGDVVWAGWLMDTDEEHEDVIFYCYGYLGGLFWMLSDWNQTWTNAQINTIVSDLWTRAKSGLSKSLLAFVQTGTIEAPTTTTGGSTPIVLPNFRSFYSVILTVFQQLAAVGMSNTANTVVFEITHSSTPTFNFWKNRGSLKADARLEFGGNVLKYRRRRKLVYRRNDVYAVGSAPHDVVMRDNQADTADFDTWGRRMGSALFGWARDEAELQRANQHRLKIAKREDVDLTLITKANSIVPPGATGASVMLSDLVPVSLRRGVTQLEETFQLIGYQTIAQRGVEHVHLMFQEQRV